MIDPVDSDYPGRAEQRDDRASALHNSLAVEELVQANQESNATMLRLVNSVRDETKARDRKVEVLEKNQHQMRQLSVLGIVAICCLLVMAVFNAVSIAGARRNAATTAAISEETHSINGTLLDCINSTGVCGQANAKAQVRFLDTVKLYELTVLYCARTNPQPLDPKGDKFLSCVAKLYPSGPALNRQDQ